MTTGRGAIIIGASSGIGEALARRLAADGYEIGLAARRVERLREISADLPTKSYVAAMDVTDSAEARDRFVELAEAMPSVAAHVGNGDAPAYNASKAYVSRYLEGLRYRGADRDADVTITTIEPGFVDTKLSLGGFWECSPETAAEQIARAIRTAQQHAYVTRRWRAIAWLVDFAPEWLLRRLF
ncbi:SDR family NAD(P)-dependent oxidoreductase [Natrinema pallidum]|uniref:SDR family NAD(P)-dependent oxidoreductase n=1 Tax=Natrinema pallidum TaxID=69527 RepID=A0A4P9TCN9_9EURY|nr:SDR family NAD(P)-dependent oxidoreductase [Natrinema pallidum]QCW02317.1 SDR family NAD(P)-dependent oxidoreductase [Natrinema pallidum]